MGWFVGVVIFRRIDLLRLFSIKLFINTNDGKPFKIEIKRFRRQNLRIDPGRKNFVSQENSKLTFLLHWETCWFCDMALFRASLGCTLNVFVILSYFAVGKIIAKSSGDVATKWRPTLPSWVTWFRRAVLSRENRISWRYCGWPLRIWKHWEVN